MVNALCTVIGDDNGEDICDGSGPSPTRGTASSVTAEEARELTEGSTAIGGTSSSSAACDRGSCFEDGGLVMPMSKQ